MGIVPARHGAHHQDIDYHNYKSRNCGWNGGASDILHSPQENVSYILRHIRIVGSILAM